MSFDQELYQSPRSKEIERTFLENKEAVKEDLLNLALTVEEICIKWNVQGRNVRKWADRLNIDMVQRTKDRRQAGYRKPQNSKPPKKKLDPDSVQSTRLLSMKW